MFIKLGLFFYICWALVCMSNAATQTITLEDNFYNPSTVSINVGDSVHWTGTTANAHNIYQTVSASNLAAASGGFSSGSLKTTNDFTHTFGSAGTFFFACAAHGGSGMKGSVTVSGATTTTTTTAAPTTTPPEAATTTPTSTAATTTGSSTTTKAAT